MLNRSASLAMSTSILKALPGKLDIKRHSPSILYFWRAVKAKVKAIFHQGLHYLLILLKTNSRDRNILKVIHEGLDGV